MSKFRCWRDAVKELVINGEKVTDRHEIEATLEAAFTIEEIEPGSARRNGVLYGVVAEPVAEPADCEIPE